MKKLISSEFLEIQEIGTEIEPEDKLMEYLQNFRCTNYESVKCRKFSDS